MGRWFCSVVLHDCRLAPITDIARDFRRAKAKHGIVDTVVKLNANQNHIRDAVDKMATGIRKEVDSLAARVEEVNLACEPELYVVNNTTKSIHRALTTIADAGAGAAAHCGFKVAFAPKTFLQSLPNFATKEELRGA